MVLNLKGVFQSNFNNNDELGDLDVNLRGYLDYIYHNSGRVIWILDEMSVLVYIMIYNDRVR